jgi:hypothetical protein
MMAVSGCCLAAAVASGNLAKKRTALDVVIYMVVPRRHIHTPPIHVKPTLSLSLSLHVGSHWTV